MAKKRAKPKQAAAKNPDHTPKYTFRLPAETIAQLDEISAGALGANRTIIIIAAVAELHERRVGKKSRKNPGDVS